MKDAENANVGKGIITMVISTVLSGAFILVIYFEMASNDLMLSICIVFILFILTLDDWTTSAKIEKAEKLIDQYSEYTSIIGKVTLLLAHKIKLLENSEKKI